MPEISEEALSALTGLGENWRLDWNYFDGRSLRDQLYAWEAAALNPETNWQQWKEDWYPNNEEW